MKSRNWVWGLLLMCMLPAAHASGYVRVAVSGPGGQWINYADVSVYQCSNTTSGACIQPVLAATGKSSSTFTVAGNRWHAASAMFVTSKSYCYKSNGLSNAVYVPDGKTVTITVYARTPC